MMASSVYENEVYDMYDNDDESTKLACTDAIIGSKPFNVMMTMTQLRTTPT